MKKFIIIAILLISNMGIFGTVNTERKENINIPKETESNVVEIVDTKEEKNIQEKNDNKEKEESENKIISKEQTKIETPKEQIKIQSNQADNTTSKNQETKQNPQENMQQKVTKEQIVTENKNEKEKETEKEEKQNQEKKNTGKSNNTKELKCSNGNHFLDAGNSNKWFNTEEEAIAYYDIEQKKWGDLYRNNKISYEEYTKKCPYRL